MDKEVKEKRKYNHKNLQKTYVASDIYEDFVTELLQDNENYFAIKVGYWDKTRTVFSIQKEDLKHLKEQKKALFDKLIHNTSWSNTNGEATRTRKNLIAKLDEYNSKIVDYSKGKKLYHKIIDFKGWKEIMKELNFRIQDKLINAEKYKITGLGYLEIIRVEKSKSSYLKYKNYEDEYDDYILLILNKVCKFRNKQVYYVRPTYGDKDSSFKNRIYGQLAKNPVLRSRFRYINKKDMHEMSLKSKLRVERYKQLLKEKNGSL